MTGGDGSTGIGRAARAKPDGYTITIGTNSTHVLNGAYYSLPYDVLNDFAPIMTLVTGSLVILGRNTMLAKDLKELIGWLKGNPDKASAGSDAVAVHVLTEFLQKETGTHFALVPYRGLRRPGKT